MALPFIPTIIRVSTAHDSQKYAHIGSGSCPYSRLSCAFWAYGLYAFASLWGGNSGITNENSPATNRGAIADNSFPSDIAIANSIFARGWEIIHACPDLRWLEFCHDCQHYR